MAISYIGSATGTNSIASMPAHQAGDLLLFFAFRDGSTTAPSLPSGYTNKLTKSESGLNVSCRVGYKIAASNSETSGTWTSATSLICQVYRGVDQTTPLGGSSSYNTTDAGYDNVIEYRTITMSNTSGSSWVAGFAGHEETNTSLETAPTGMVNRTNVVDATDEAAGHDTNGGVTSWSTQTVSAGGTLGGWCSAVVEILAGSTSTTLTPSLFTNSQTFYAPTVTKRNTLTPSLFTNSQTFYAATATASRTLTPSLFSNAQSFQAPTVTGSNALTPSLFSNSQTFYSPIAAATYSLTPSLFTPGQTFYSAFVSQGSPLFPALFTNTQTFYAPAVTVGSVTLQPGLFTNSQSFYGPAITQIIAPGLFANAQSFYSASAAAGLNAGLFTNSQTFYSASATVGAVTLTPSLFTNDHGYFDQVVAAYYAVTPSLFTNSQTFYAPTAAARNTLTPALFTNSAAFYAHNIVGGSALHPELFTNGQTFYSPSVTVGAVTLHPSLFTNATVFYGGAIAGGESYLYPALFTNSQTFFAHNTTGDIGVKPVKLQIIPINEFDDATNTATSSASGFGIANAETELKAETWRSTSLSSQTITSTFAAATTVSAVALAFTNLHAGSTVRVKLYTETADVVPVMDSGVQELYYAYDPPEGFSTIGLIAFAHGGGTYFSMFFNDYAIKKCEIIITSAANPDGYIEIGRVIIGDRFEPTYNARAGVDFTYPETTTVKRTKAGDQVVNRGTQTKQIGFDLEFMPDSDRQTMASIIRRSGLHEPIFICLQPDEISELFQAGQIYGRRLDGGLRYDYQDMQSMRFTVEEV